MSQNFFIADDDGVLDYVRYRRGFKRLRISVPESKFPSRTKQADAKAADINFIVSRYKKTGELPVSRRAAMFQDFSAVDLKEAMDLFTHAQQSFAALPAATRNAFHNDPGELLRALDNMADPDVHRYLFKAGVLAQDYVEPSSGEVSPPASPAVPPSE